MSNITKTQKKFILLASALFIAIIFTGLVGYVSAANPSTKSYSPGNGYATALGADISFTALDTIHLQLKEGSTVLAETGGTVSSSGWAYYSISPVFLETGHTYTLYAFTNGGSGVTDLLDLNATFTPYYYITVTSPSGYGAPTSSAWVAYGGSFTASVTNPWTVSSTEREGCININVDGEPQYVYPGGVPQVRPDGTVSYTFTNIQADHTAEFVWLAQYKTTFAISGTDATAYGNALTYTVDAGTVSGGSGGNIDYALVFGSGYSIWASSGSQITYSYATTIASTITLTHFQFASASPSSPVTISGATTITGSYTTATGKYAVTFAATGLDYTSTGPVISLSINGGSAIGLPFSSLPYTFYFDPDTNLTYTYMPTGYSTILGKEFRTLGPNYASPITVHFDLTITASYSTYYQLTTSSSYSTIVNTPSSDGWYLAGSTAYFYPTETTVTGDTGVRYVFSGWIGSGSGSYTGSSSSASVIMNNPITETANWQTQYKLDVISTYFPTTGTGWYNAGTTVTFTITSPLDISTGVRIYTNGWTGLGGGSYTGPAVGSTSVVMNNPITETANAYTTAYYLTINSAYGTVIGQGWQWAGSTVYAGLTSGTASVGDSSRYTFLSWSVGGTNYAASAPIVMSGPTTVTATWAAQYYLTVTSPYGLPTTGSGWYNSGTSAYAGIATNIDGTHTFIGWGGDATGASITSNPIIMNGPKTALASWTGTVTPSGPVTYNVTVNGPYYENGNPANGYTATFQLSFANNTIFTNSLTSTTSPGSIFISSTSPFVQLTWNASSTSGTLNATRVYTFGQGINGINDTIVNLFILDPAKPAYQYTFSVSDFYGMKNPFLQTSLNTNSTNSFVVERVNLNETGGYVTFIMQQYQIYTLTFVCQQGTYSQTFTANTLGTPGQLPISLSVLAGNFPLTNTTAVITGTAFRNGTSITAYYLNPNATTTWVTMTITHSQGSVTITDYGPTNVTGDSQTFIWDQADTSIEYTVTLNYLLDDGTTNTITLHIAPDVSANPWDSIDWAQMGNFIPTLPTSYSGWGGIDPTQLIAAFLILFALGIGSYYSTGISCLICWVIAGLLLKMGWWQGSIPLFALGGFFTIIILIDEYKKGAGFNL